MSAPVKHVPPTAPAVTRQEGEDKARRDSRRRCMRRLGLLALGWVAVAAAWQFTSLIIFPRVLPTPYAVAVAMWDIVLSGQFLSAFAASVGKTFAGFAVAVSVGAPIGYLMGRYNYWRAFFHDGMTITGSIPSIVYAVLSLIVFGISNLGPVLAVALVSAPYIAINVAEGIRSVDNSLVQMSQVFGRSRLQILRHVLIPTVVPFIFAAVRMSFAVAWKVEALTEVFGGSSGVGFQLRLEYQIFNTTGVLAWMFLFIAFMLTVERLVLREFETRLLSWRPQERIRA